MVKRRNDRLYFWDGEKMKLSTKSKEYIIPEYSLTGDLLSFLTCNLQYRYQNKGHLTPLMPIQLWFGEFIHSALEEAYLKWEKSGDNENLEFPWDWESEIRPIEELIIDRLKVKGLNPPLGYDWNGPQNNIYSARLERSINLWGPHLFPLIIDAEMPLKGLRPLEDENFRSDYYSINGVVDVLSFSKINKLLNFAENQSKIQKTLDFYYDNDNRNKIIEYLSSNKETLDLLKEKLAKDNIEDYEIIIDYKGMRRPSAPSEEEMQKIQALMSEGNLFESEIYEKYKVWIQHEWQILTYAWLRRNQTDMQEPVVGIIFYLNDMVRSNDDLEAIKEDLSKNQTDISKDRIDEADWNLLENWNPYSEKAIHNDLSTKFKMDRSIRIINIDEELFENSLNQFDNVVKEIESSMIKEMEGAKIQDAWKAEAEERTCSACDFRAFCNKKKNEDLENKQVFTIP